MPGEESSSKTTKWHGSKKSLKTEDFFLVHQSGDIQRGIALNLQREKDSRSTMNSRMKLEERRASLVCFKSSCDRKKH